MNFLQISNNVFICIRQNDQQTVVHFPRFYCRVSAVNSRHNFLVCEFYETQNTSNYGLESTTTSPVWPMRSSFIPCNQNYDEYCLNEGERF